MTFYMNEPRLTKFSRCSRISNSLKRQALCMPILSYWPVCSEQYGKCKNVKYMVQNNLAGLPMLFSYRCMALTDKALRLMYFYVSVAGC